MRLFRTFCILLIAIIFSSCGGPKLINSKKMSMIYADMFLADQWIWANGMQYITDTVAVYNPIFKKYGYNVDDFRYSVKYYLNDIPLYNSIAERAKSILEKRLAEVNDEIKHQEKVDSILRYREYLIKTADSIWSYIYLDSAYRCKQDKKFMPNVDLNKLFVDLDSLQTVNNKIDSIKHHPIILKD